MVVGSDRLTACFDATGQGHDGPPDLPERALPDPNDDRSLFG